MILRMNVVPLFSDRKEASKLWLDSIFTGGWIHSIKVRFVEDGDDYWFIMGADSQNPDSNLSFFKKLAKSENYERFKKGHEGEAYLRFGVYSEKSLSEVKRDQLCNCGHEAEDHDKNDDDACLYEVCDV